LHPRLRTLPTRLFNQVASFGQRLHEEFLVLQQKGLELTGVGRRPSLEAETGLYLAQLEEFATRLVGFVREAEDNVRKNIADQSTLGGDQLYANMADASIPHVHARSSYLSSSGDGIPALRHDDNNAPMVSIPDGRSDDQRYRSTSSSAQGGSIIPSTDRRLSNIIEKVTELMHRFQDLKPLLTKVPAPVLEPLAQRGQELHQRFVALQHRGVSIAGNNAKPMQEIDAMAYVEDMEAFFADQSSYVRSVRQILEANQKGVPTGGEGGTKNNDDVNLFIRDNSGRGFPNRDRMPHSGLNGLVSLNELDFNSAVLPAAAGRTAIGATSW